MIPAILCLLRNAVPLELQDRFTYLLIELFLGAVFVSWIWHQKWTVWGMVR